VADLQTLAKAVQVSPVGHLIQSLSLKDIVTLELSSDHLLTVCHQLRKRSPFNFEQLVDICGIDYSDYGYMEWRTDETTESGFSRGVCPNNRQRVIALDKPRFGVVYHLLSVSQNHRIRLKVYLSEELVLPSVINIWASANWYEREAFDLFGIYFKGHPDLRRLLTDYGF